jgi:hypothetical protein
LAAVPKDWQGTSPNGPAGHPAPAAQGKFDLAADPSQTLSVFQFDRPARREISVEARQEFERQEKRRGKRQEKARPKRPGFLVVEVSDRERITARPG